MHMAKPNPLKPFLLLIPMVLMVASLAGCGGSSGGAGAPGPEGPPGSPGLQATINKVTISSTPVVDFTVVDERGFAVPGITQASFTIAKLIPGRDGDSSAWQSYINRVEQPGTGDWPGTEPQIHATAESNGALQDNGDGTYRYTFATDLSTVTEPLAVSYQPELTHLVGLQLGGATAGTNAIYSFQPSTGRTSLIADRRIVAQETCGTCHGASLDAHGGSRVDAEYCVACHNPGTTDAQSGQTADFRVMVHKIHMGSDLPSGDPYVLWGFGNTRKDFSDVAHPQDVRNCLTCHDPENPRTPQARQILTHPSIAACGSCHENVNFATGEGHSASNIVADNDSCTACHSTGGIAGNVLESHAIPTKLASEEFQLNLLGLKQQGEQALVTFSVTNPKDGSTYALPGPLRALAARLQWTERNSSDYGRAFPLDADALANAVPAGGGAYEVPIAIAAEDAPVDPTLLTVSLEGSAWLDGVQDGAVVRIAGATRFFAPNGAADVVERRQVVEDQACQSCHGQYEGPYSGHDQNRTDHVQMCVMCHNPSQARPGTAETPREPHETSTDMMYMTHAIHASDIRGANAYRSFGDVGYPRPSSDCRACHTADTFQLTSVPRNKPAMATRVGNGGGVQETFVSPQSAVCWSCHIGASAENHMSFFGGQINVSEAELLIPGQETCVGCHGPGRVLDVGAVHPLR